MHNCQKGHLVRTTRRHTDGLLLERFDLVRFKSTIGTDFVLVLGSGGTIGVFRSSQNVDDRSADMDMGERAVVGGSVRGVLVRRRRSGR